MLMTKRLKRKQNVVRTPLTPEEIFWDPPMYKVDLEATMPNCNRPQGYTTFFMLNSSEHKIYPTHNC